jgi:DNA-binding response OmpR family regulator
MGRSVLIVDDNEMASELLSEFLEISGHDARVAHSGQAALNAVLDRRPDVFIVDIVLPDMDGYALATALRSQDSKAKIIALSGLPQNMRRGDQVLFDAWIEKPANLDALENLLATI